MLQVLMRSVSWLSLPSRPLMQPRSSKAGRRVAALTLLPVLAEMNVVLQVAGNTGLRELHLVRRLAMAALADKLRVRAVELEARFLAVVEVPDAPAVRRMAARAVRAEAALVDVVALVAVDALRADVAIRARDMALLAGNGDVQADEREARQVVIEAHVLVPACGRVARGAVLAELAGVHVARAMAADAFGWKLLR